MSLARHTVGESLLLVCSLTTIQTSYIRCIVCSLHRPGRSAALYQPICLSASISLEPQDQSSLCVQSDCGRGLFLLWWHCDTLCSSGLTMTSSLAAMGRTAMIAALQYRGGVWCLWMPCCEMCSRSSALLSKNKAIKCRQTNMTQAYILLLLKPIWSGTLSCATCYHSMHWYSVNPDPTQPQAPEQLQAQFMSLPLQ